MAKLDVQYLIDVPRSVRNGGASIISTGGGSSALPDFTLYVKRDGSTPMLGNFDVGGFSVTNVSLIDGIDLPAHVANPNAHHNQTHEIIGSDHTVSASPLQLVGAVSLNTLGIISPLSDATLSVKEAILKTDASGFLKIVKLTTTDSVRTPIIDTATGHLTLSPASDLLLNPGSKLTKIYATHAIQTNGFTSGWTGYGFRLDQDISRSNKSHFEVDDIVVRGRMSVYELLIRQIRATNGSIFVTSSAKIKNVAPISGGYRVSTVASGETSTTDLSHGFLAGDLIRSQRTKWNGSVSAGIYQSDLQVTTVINLYEFDAALVSGDAPSIGMEYVRLGNVSNADRRGSVYLTADDTNAPFIDVVDGISSHSLWNSSGAIKVRIGKLTGITGQSNTYGIFSGNSAATWQSMDTLNGFRIGYAGTTRFRVDTTGNLNIYNTSSLPIITLANDGTSYFSGVMTIGASGEIRQGTGTFGTNWTGLRIWNDAGKGRIGGYNSSILQWFADTNGELRAGNNAIALSYSGMSIKAYQLAEGNYAAQTENQRSVTWWDDIDNRTGVPVGKVFANSAPSGGLKALELEVVPDGTGTTPAIWLQSNKQLWFVNLLSIIGIPGIYPSRATTSATPVVQFNGSLQFQSTLERGALYPEVDLGTAGKPFRTLYVENIVATSTSGAAISGSIWQNDAADMYIRSNSASNRTLYIANPGTGSMNLDVEMNITLGGTVDGVDISGFYTAYQAHTHSHSSLSGITADQHHAQTHVLATNTGLGPYQTMSGAASGQVLRASSATTANFQALSHADLTGITADQHHAQVHDITSANHTVTGSFLQLVGLTGTNALGLLTPSFDPGAASAILRTNSLGYLTLQMLALRGNVLRSLGVLALRNVDDSAYQSLALSSLYSIDNIYYSNQPAQFVTDAGLAQGARVGSLLVSNSYASTYTANVPTNGIYSLGSIRGDTSVITPLLKTLSGSMTLQPAVDLLLDPASNLVKIQSGVSLQAHNYASQTTGWRITNDGQADFRYLFTDEMHAKSFIADLEQALAGGQIISKSVAILAVQNFVAPAAGGWTYIYVEDLPSAPNMAVFESGDTIGIRKFSRANGSLTISWCWGVVTSYVDGNGSNFSTGTQQWIFTRSASPNAGAMAIGASVEVGAIVLDYGQSGNGIYEVNAIDGLRAINSPYLRFSRWTSHPASGMVERVRLGNLKGIWGQDEYGLFAGTGTANTDRWLRLSDYAAGNGINNLPFRLRNNGVTTVEFSSWDNVWLGPSSADKRLLWNGTTLEVRGEIYVTGGNAATTDNIAGATNLVRNSSFELDSNNDGLANGFSIYNNDGGAVPTTASIVGGFNSPAAQRISWSGTNASTKGIFFGTGTRLAGRNYVIAFWARTSAPSGIVLAFNGGVNYPSSVTPLLPTASDSTWRRYAYVVQWAANSDDSWFVYSNAAITNGWVDFDGLMVYEGTAIVPYSAAPTDVVAYGGLINMPLLTTGAGLYSSAERMGYWNGSAWKMWMNNAGNFFFGGDTGARLQWDGTKLAGYDSLGEEQWSANSTDGKFKAGGGEVWIDEKGVSLTSTTSYSVQNTINWTTGDRTTTVAEVYGSFFPGPEGGRIRNRINIKTNNVSYGGATRIDGEVFITAKKLGSGAYSSIELSADYLRFNGNNVWHSGMSGDFRSNETINFRNLAGVATNITANSVTTYGGYIQSDNTIVASNNAASAYQIIMASAFHPTTGYIRSDSNIVLTNLSGASYQHLYASNGIFSGIGTFGTYAVIGTGVSGGFYQDVNNGAYRALSNTGNKGFYFQNFGGSTTPMFVGLVGTYAGQVGIGTITPTSGFALDVNGAAYFRSSLVLGWQTRIESIGYLTSAPTINSGEVRMYVTTGTAGGLRFMIAHNHSGTIKYRWMDLDGTAAIWNYSGSWADVLN